MNKLQNCVLAMALIFSVGISATVDASAGSQASPHAFKSGFSSQRSSAARSSPAPSKGQFGGFGSRHASAPPAAANRDQGSSALSRGLDQQASRDRALRTLDARRAPPAQPQPIGTPMPAQQQVGNSPAPLPQPVVLHQRGGMGDMLTGVLIGRAMSDNHSTVYAGGPAARVDMGGVLRMFMWLLILAAIGWAIYFTARAMKRSRQARTPNYTFERE